MAKYESFMNSEEIEAKLKYIELRWGLNKEAFDTLLEDPENLRGMGKSAKRRFGRYLASLEQAFSVLSQRHPIEDHFKEEAFRPYLDEIRVGLGNNPQRCSAYLSGDWDEEILRVVSVAQRKHLVPREAPSEAQQNPKVKFKPASEYTGYFNR